MVVNFTCSDAEHKRMVKVRGEIITPPVKEEINHEGMHALGISACPL
jgi:hypothetical protein